MSTETGKQTDLASIIAPTRHIFLSPHYDDIARTMLARHARGELTSAAARDTIGLLRDEAEYMHRVGRHEEAEKALAEAKAIRP